MPVANPVTPAQKPDEPRRTAPRQHDPGAAVTTSLRRHLATHRGLLMHSFAFAVVAVDLLILNLLTNRDTIWAVWPIGVWGIIVTAHAGYSFVKPGLFGIHLFGGGATCVGLFIINIFHGRDDANFGGWWFIWPVLAWLVSLVIHLPFAFDLIPGVRPGTSKPSSPADR